MASPAGDTATDSAEATQPTPEPALASADELPIAQIDTEEPYLTTGKMVSAGVLGGINAAIYAWTYFAWYRPRQKYDNLVFLNEGWFGPDTYAGGADKLGHFFANYAFVRGSVAVLEAGGWDRRVATIASSAATLAFFTVIEIKDGYHQGFGFSFQDMTANVTGVALGALMTEWPALDRAIDVRIQYFPTRAFIRQLRDNGVVNAAEDYSGQAFMLAYHLGSIEPLRESRYMGWTRYFDVVAGYQARNYKPEPTEPGFPRQQELFFGITLDMQAVLGAWSESLRPSSPGWSGAVRTGADFFEYFQIPYTTLKVVGLDRDNGMLPIDGMAAP
ncbi:DUF2279 domain-containing protein [Haliangium sp.]|uniref:DUF2279 domain-containing protein n=1 Tax=Haliangium sp. TaxID=2663208 RepID=UPI003D0CBC12